MNKKKYKYKQRRKGFFCVVYFKDDKKTVWYRNVRKPYRLANYYNGRWLWIKIFVDKQTYFSNSKTTDYYAIFDKNNDISVFSYSQVKNH